MGSVCGNVSTALVLLTSDAPWLDAEHAGKKGDFFVGFHKDFMGVDGDFMLISWD